VADDLAERAEGQKRRYQRDLVNVDDPDHVGRADMKIRGDGGQRDVGDGRIERGHRECGEDRDHRPSALVCGQAVERRRSLRRNCNFQHFKEFRAWSDATASSA
jgi:hypothetical protein